MIQLREQYWAVEVPSMAFGFDVNNYGNDSEYMYTLDVEDIVDEPNSDETLIVKPLPPGTWQIVCTSKEATEGQAESIVCCYGDQYIDYTATEQDWKEHEVNWFQSALPSLSSLLASKGCDINKNYLILKKD
jgi:hypothetical protein